MVKFIKLALTKEGLFFKVAYIGQHLNYEIMVRNPCTICGKNMVGRSDKKYCSIACKNKFHHPSKHTKGDILKVTNRFLFQNFKIMESIFKEEKKNQLMVPRLLMDKMGFHFNYCTGCYINSKGKLYRYIYNYSWMEFSNQELMLNRKK